MAYGASIKKITLELNALVVGSLGSNELPHMAQPCASTAVARVTSATAVNVRAVRKRRVVMASIEIHQRKEDRPQRGDEVPIDAAHLQAGVLRRGETPALREQRDHDEPEHRDQDVHGVA